MKKIIICSIILTVFPLSSIMARGFGLGLILIEPTGLSLKIWQSHESAIDGAAAWSFDKNQFVYLYGDYLLHHFELLKVKNGELPLYYGFGARIRINKNDESKLGIRFPLGLSYLFKQFPVDIFFEVAPILNIIESTNLDLNISFGARYYFN